MDNLYLFYGQESYLLEESVKKIKKSFKELLEGINLIRIDENNVNQLISNIETPCFGFDKKLIIVRNSGLLKKEGKKKGETVRRHVSHKRKRGSGEAAYGVFDRFFQLREADHQVPAISL